MKTTSTPAHLETTTLEIGTRVRVKTTMLGKRLGITPVPRRGGEGVITGLVMGKRGKLIYSVLMRRNEYVRPVLPKDMVVHRKTKRRGRSK